jgi:hypothetical protein
MWSWLLVACIDATPLTPDATITAVARCTAQACEPAGVADEGVYVGYRPDFFYPYGPGASSGDPAVAFGTDDAPAYPEADIADPTGGRVVIVGRAAAAGQLAAADVVPGDVPGGRSRAAFDVRVGGLSTADAVAAGQIDWLRVWPTRFEAGDPVWVTLHTRDPATPIALEVQTDTGATVLSANTPLAASPVVVTSVAHAEREVWVHLHNDDAVPHTLDRLVLDGRDITASACVAVPTVQPGASITLTIPVCEAPAQGAPWTLVATWADATPSVAAGRVMPPHFPTHTWPSEADCPLPGVNDANYETLAAAGLDTFFVRSAYDHDGCASVPTVDAIAQDFGPAGAWAMLDEFTPDPAETTRVLARMLGDEVDNRSQDELLTTQRPRALAEETQGYGEQSPDLPTYIGASRHRFTGMFAGVADLQGMDMYAAACAPHITDFGTHPPLRGPYDYLRSTRNNHMPGTTWLYAQGLGGWPAQPSPGDIRHAALSVVAAGGKGLMWFQTPLDKAAENPESWAALSEVTRQIRAIGPRLRLGDPTGAATTPDRAIVEAVRVPGGLVLVVLPLATTDGPAELPCALGSYTPWQIAEQVVHVDVVVPDDLGVGEVFELVGDQLVDAGSTIQGRTLGLDLAFDSQNAGRLLVIADDPELRAEIEASLR